MLGDRATLENLERARQAMGVDRPILEQFLTYIGKLASGDLGQSLLLRVPVSKLVIERLPVTLTLTAFASVLAAAIAVPLALIAALRRGSTLDLAIRGTFQVGLSLPGFFVSVVLFVVLAERLVGL